MKLGNDGGFTLIEVIVTLVIFAVIGTLLSSLFINGLSGLQLSTIKNEEINTLQHQLNEAILNYDNTNSDEIEVVFNEGEIDEERITVNGELIRIVENNEVILEYFEVVMPE